VQNSRKDMCELLKNLGYSVFEAGDFQSALDLVQIKNPDILVTEYAFPEGKADILVDKVKDLLPKIPILLVTSEISSSILINMIQYNFLVIVNRPYKENGINEAIDYLKNWDKEYDGSNRRKYRRIETKLQALIKDHGPAIVMNVSVGGIFAVTEKEIRIGELVRINIPEIEGITLDGIVAWVRPRDSSKSIPSAVGIKFDQLNTKTLETMKGFMLNRTKLQGSEYFYPIQF